MGKSSRMRSGSNMCRLRRRLLHLYLYLAALHLDGEGLHGDDRGHGGPTRPHVEAGAVAGAFNLAIEYFALVQRAAVVRALVGNRVDAALGVRNADARAR